MLYLKHLVFFLPLLRGCREKFHILLLRLFSNKDVPQQNPMGEISPFAHHMQKYEDMHQLLNYVISFLLGCFFFFLLPMIKEFGCTVAFFR